MMRRGALLPCLLLVAGCASAPPPPPAGSRQAARIAAVQADPAQALALLNRYRASRGLGAVQPDPALAAMAQRQAAAMVAADSLSHDVAGSFGSRIAAAGLDTAKAGENIGGGYLSTQEAFAGWQHSPAHDANLLMPGATRFGLGMAKDARTRYGAYWAMEIAADPPPRP